MLTSSFTTVFIDVITTTKCIFATSEAPSKATLATDPPDTYYNPSPYFSASLHHHNIRRQNHSTPDAIWDTTIAEYAATLASSCAYGHNL
jgi:hypothetical protein